MLLLGSKDEGTDALVRRERELARVLCACNLRARAAQEVRKPLGIREKERKPRRESNRDSSAGNVAGDQELIWHGPGPELSSQNHETASHQTGTPYSWALDST